MRSSPEQVLLTRTQRGLRAEIKPKFWFLSGPKAHKFLCGQVSGYFRGPTNMYLLTFPTQLFWMAALPGRYRFITGSRTRQRSNVKTSTTSISRWLDLSSFEQNPPKDRIEKICYVTGKSRALLIYKYREQQHGEHWAGPESNSIWSNQFLKWAFKFPPFLPFFLRPMYLLSYIRLWHSLLM